MLGVLQGVAFAVVRTTLGPVVVVVDWPVASSLWMRMDSVRGVFAGDGGLGHEYLTFDPSERIRSPLAPA